MPTKSIEIVDDNISVISSVYDNDFVPENTYNNDGWWKWDDENDNVDEAELDKQPLKIKNFVP